MIYSNVTGNIGKIERKEHNGSKFYSMSIASNDSKKNVNWVDVTLWGHENLAPYLQKGAKVGLHGEMTQEKYTYNGEQHSKMKLAAKSIELLGQPRQQQTKADPVNQVPNVF